MGSSRKGICKMINSFMQPYADAGHDLESLFKPGVYKCARCGKYQINLSEDLMYGPMSQCITTTPDAIAESRDQKFLGMLVKLDNKND